MRFTNSADRYFGLREFAGRSKTVVPVVVGHGYSRITVMDDEPLNPELGNPLPGRMPEAENARLTRVASFAHNHA